LTLFYPNWLALPEPTFSDGLQLGMMSKIILFKFKKNFLVMPAITKITAAKLLILINLPVFLLVAGVYQIGSAVII